jgi:hypothetical protein
MQNMMMHFERCFNGHLLVAKWLHDLGGIGIRVHENHKFVIGAAGSNGANNWSSGCMI